MRLFQFSHGLVINIDHVLTYQETEYGLEVRFSDGGTTQYSKNDSENAKLIDAILAIPVTYLDLSEEDLRTIQALSKQTQRLSKGEANE